MAAKIVLKRSSVSGKIPTISDIDYGELSINYTDGILYYKRSDNTIQSLPTVTDAATLGGISPSGYARLGSSYDNLFLSTTPSTSPVTGSIVATGGVGIGGDLHLAGNAIIGGNLTVSGITTTNLTANNSYTNALLELNKPIAGYVLTNNVDSGLKYNYYDPAGYHNIVTGGSGNGTSATLVVTGAPYPIGSFITVSGVLPAGFNGTFKVTSSDNTSVTYANTTNASVTTTGQLGTVVRITEFNLTGGTTVSGSKVSTITYSSPALSLTAGDIVTISGCTPTGYNGTWTVLSATVGSFTFQNTQNLTDITVTGKVTVSNRYAFSGWTADEKAFEFYKVGAVTPAGTFRGIYGEMKAACFHAMPTGGVTETELTDGLLFRGDTMTVYNNSTASSTTVPFGGASRLKQITIDAINSGVTYTNAATLYIDGAPAAGHNVTISNSYSLYVGSGNSRFDGTVQHQGLVPTAGSNIDQITTLTQNLTLITDWIDTGINDAMLSSGTYVIQVYANDTSVGGSNNNEYYSGTMSWYAGTTDSVQALPTDEIELHRAGGSNDGGLFLRTFRSPSTDSRKLRLQIYSNTNNSSSANYVFKFRRVI